MKYFETSTVPIVSDNGQCLFHVNLNKYILQMDIYFSTPSCLKSPVDMIYIDN